MKNSRAAYRNPGNENDLRHQFAEDVRNGLSRTRKSLPCKYIYDNAGSELFSRIMTLSEYYPARCEAEILETHGPSLAAAIREGPINLIELGAGDGRKTRILIEKMVDAGCTFTYVPLDISHAAVQECADRLCGAFPDLPVSGMVSDYFDGLKWLSRQNHRRNVALFLG
jgi:L-histidine Nalpha-methyltransferase